MLRKLNAKESLELTHHRMNKAVFYEFFKNAAGKSKSEAIIDLAIDADVYGYDAKTILAIRKGIDIANT